MRIFLWSGLLWQLCFGSYWTLLFVRVVVELDLPPLELLLLGTAKEVTIVTAEIPTGIVADIRSRRLSVILGFAITGVAIVGAGFASSFGLLVVTQILWGFGSTFRSGAETAWLTDELGSSEAAEPVLVSRARVQLLGTILGAGGAAGLAAVTTLTTALATAGVLLLGWALVLAVIMPEHGFCRVRGSVIQRFRVLLVNGATATLTVPALRILFIAIVMAGFASEAVDRLQVKRLDAVGWPSFTPEATFVAGLVIVQALGAVALLSVAGRRLAGHRLVPALVLLHLGTGIGVVALARSNVLFIAASGLAIQGGLRTVAQTVVIGWTNNFATDENRATVHSFIGQAQSLGEITGGIGLGLIATTFGLPVAIGLAGAVYLSTAALTATARHHWPNPASN